MADNTIATAYVQIEPSTRGMKGMLESSVGAEAESAGKSIGGKFGSAIGTAAKVGIAGVTAATTAVAGFGAKSVEVGKTFDKSMSQVAATMGYVVKEGEYFDSEGKNVNATFQELNNFAQKMGATTAFSASQAADALNYMALAGYDADTSMKMLPTVLNLAAAGDMELARASDMVTDAQSALGLNIEETTNMVDIMAKTASSANTSVEGLGEAFLTVGPTAKDLKGGVEEMSTVLGTLANSGIKGSEAGTHLRNMMLAMNPTTDKAAMAWERLGLSAYDADGNLRPLNDTFEDLSNRMATMSTQERTQTLSAMFNKTDLASINTMLSATMGNVDEVSAAMEKAGLAFDDFVNAEDGGNILTNAMADAFFKLKEGTLQTDAQIKEYSNSLTELGLSEEQATTFMDTFLKTAETGGNQFDTLAAKVANYENAAGNMAETIRNNLEGDLSKFNSALEGVQLNISSAVSPALREFVQIGTEGLGGIAEALSSGDINGAFEQIGTTLGEMINKIGEDMPAMVEAGQKLLSAFGQALLDNMPTLVDSALQIVTSLVQYLIQAAPQLLQAAIQMVAQLATGLAEQMPALIPQAVEMILTLVEGLYENVDMLIDAAIQLQMGLADGLIQALPILIEKAPDIIEKLVTALIINTPKIIMVGPQLIIKLIMGLMQAVPMLLMKIPQIIVQVVHAFLTSIPKLVEVGKDIVNGIWTGIKNNWATLVENVKQSAQNLVTALKSFFSIGSPSKLMRDEVGKWIPEGVAVGIEANADSPLKALGAMSGDMTSTLQSQISGEVTTSQIYSAGAIELNNTNDTQGLFDLMSQYFPQMANQSVNISLEGDAAGLFNAVRRQDTLFSKANGRSAFA